MHGPRLARVSSFRLIAPVPKTVTEGVAVEVESYFVPEQSDPVIDRYVFAYRVRISNESPTTVQLMRRHWYITEGNGTVREVEGEGVVGEQPVMAPGESHEYTSVRGICTEPTKCIAKTARSSRRRSPASPCRCLARCTERFGRKCAPDFGRLGFPRIAGE